MDTRSQRCVIQFDGRPVRRLVFINHEAEKMNDRLFLTAFLRRDSDALPDPFTLSSAAQRMLSVPIKATE